MTSYTILAAAVEAVIEEKNSEFLCFLHPITSREEAMAHIERYRQLHPNANHVCWAYVLGNTRQPLTQAFNDDGEPAGTAGKPMLHVLTERDLGNCLAVIVRYFGGVKLGAGGLVRAYSAAVSTAVNGAHVIEVRPSLEVDVVIDFAQEAKARHLLNQHQGKILDVNYAAQVTLHLSLDAESLAAFSQQLINETSGAAQIRRRD
jgi:uncharacterized YigZ family protein